MLRDIVLHVCLLKAKRQSQLGIEIALCIFGKGALGFGETLRAACLFARAAVNGLDHAHPFERLVRAHGLGVFVAQKLGVGFLDRAYGRNLIEQGLCLLAVEKPTQKDAQTVYDAINSLKEITDEE